MHLGRSNLSRRWLVLVGALLVLPIMASAQERGQYPLGTNGFNSGVQPSPGFTYFTLFTFFDAVRLKGLTGNPIPVNASFNLFINQNFFAYVTDYKLLGGNWGVMYDLPVANGSVTLLNLGIKGGGAGIADMYIEPFDLGWHLQRADLKFAYGVVAPTGRFARGATDNIGSGYWGHQLQFAATIYLTANKGTSFSVYNNYEIHQRKTGTNMTPGQTYSLEWGLAQAVPLDSEKKKLLQAGAVGYLQTQTTNDSGTLLIPALNSAHYHVYAIGPEVAFIMPDHGINLLFRYEPEFGAQKRSEGRTLVFGGGLTF